MTGSLSPSLCKLDKLTTLIVADWKDISGEIPACVTSLPDLRILELIGNKITGQIPENIGQLSKLTVLNLADNKICGSIPASIVNLGKLKHLELSNNQLTGEIPSDIGKLGMDLSHNHLCGPIPNGSPFDHLEASSFSNNDCLCGSPLRTC
ncbi:hypothetical protein MTR67_004256 [Solanum verrucosum]|uniref:Disease resistance R13L4/SHOC-2-like LRR domain-containing protein n=1 Tax=Solanum verrucosum TaxID=315347 RepID=A0AAF0PYK4_SOLVR|nr:hypothetical protein MTR67_004256 [Solanum verrucosum]